MDDEFRSSEDELDEEAPEGTLEDEEDLDDEDEDELEDGFHEVDGEVEEEETF